MAGTSVEIATGRLRGVAEDGVRRFLGIPFAAAPTGARRFAPPRPATPWAGVREAVAFGAMAPQAESPLGFLVPGVRQSEDCLQLNVWAPEGATGRPVLVWIHGGAFRGGSAASPMYDGTALARRGRVVVVTIQYRLGALGFLAHPELAEGDGDGGGNRGLLDQILALEWVRENAVAFGGDAGNVTVFGESAGGASVTCLLASPRARGLFHRAITQSGSPWTVAPAAAARHAERLAELVGVPNVAALREAPAPALVAAQTKLQAETGDDMVLRPVRDDAVLPRRPLDAARAGETARVPTILGTNLDEWKLWGTFRFQIDDARLLRRLGRLLPGADVEGLVRGVRAAREARGEPASAADLWFAIQSERIFRVPTTRLAAALAAHEPRTHAYLFTWPSPAMRGWLGACHGVEIGFVFGTHAHPQVRKFSGDGPEAGRLSGWLMDAWLAFAEGGDPAADHPWPGYDGATRPTLVVGRERAIDADPRGEERRLLDAAIPDRSAA